MKIKITVIALILFSLKICAQETFTNGININHSSGDRTYINLNGTSGSSYINFKSTNGFWHISGPRSWESNNPLSIYWNNGTYNRYLNILDNGNIGIGTTTTGSHRLAVEGSIGAREIKVEANGWSDFVFYDDYKLPTLKEVENHIKEKGHLKDIPSAKEVEKEGFFLGEMDAKLLQKIEELTLYTIAQEKKIKELESLNTKFLEIQKRLEKLEKK
jgi:hypothetical protein